MTCANGQGSDLNLSVSVFIPIVKLDNRVLVCDYRVALIPVTTALRVHLRNLLKGSGPLKAGK